MRIREVMLHLRSSPLRHGLAVGSLIAATGGLVLLQAPRAGGLPTAMVRPAAAAQVTEGNVVSFSGQGASGTIALSHRAALGPGERRVFAEVKIKADSGDQARERAPVSLVVALDTSGSMGGEKITQAKQAVIKLIQEMRDEDEIAFVRYESDAKVIQPLARVGQVRASLIEQVRKIEAGGGTNIPAGLGQALSALSEAGSKRVRRVVLVSDGIDSGRQQAESIAQTATGRGVAISSLGVGLDFDESYMASVARAGRGNFAFVKEGAELAKFLRQELDESSSTLLEGATVRLKLPAGVTAGQVTGATLVREGEDAVLQVGSMFAGEERRVVLELITRLPPGETRIFQGDFAWTLLKNNQRVAAPWAQLALSGTADPAVEAQGLNGAVLASATSVITSVRQLEAVEAFNRGDGARAQALIQQNIAQINEVQAVAPPELAGSLAKQSSAYQASKDSLSVSPGSDKGKAAAKRVYHQDVSNLKSSSY